MKCNFCNKIFSSKSSLNMHQKTTKYCLKLQGKKEELTFECKYCNKKFTLKVNLTSHYGICKEKEINEKLKEKEEELKKEFNKEKENLEIFKPLFPSKSLVLNDINIIIREDGYVNLTQLCKAGGKEFFHWKENKNSKAYLHVLSSSIGIPMDELINYEIGSIKNRSTWGHPQVAINIAQWISPEFGVQVSKWIFELTITGKVELGNEKTNKELENIYQEKINNLQNKLKNYETTIFNRNIDYCPIEYYGKDIVYFLKFNIPDHLYDEYISKYPNIDNKDYSCVEFGVSSDIEKRLTSHKRDKKKDDIIFVHAIELKKRYTASKMEYYIKTVAQQLNIKFEYEKKKECVLVNEEMFNVLVNKINTGLSNLEDDLEETEEYERIDTGEEYIKYKYDIEIKKLDNEKEIKKLDIEKEKELKKLDIEKEKDIKKIEMITEVFKNKLITFDEYKNMLETIR